MGKVTNFLFGNTAGGIAEGGARGLMEGIGGLATSLRSAITGELPPAMRERLETLAVQAENLQKQGQMEINKVEAASPRLFVAGWRPFIGWVGGLAIAWCYLVQPLITWAITLWYIRQPVVAGEIHVSLANYIPPSIDLSGLWPVIIGMLGLGVYRTYEKRIGVQGNH